MKITIYGWRISPDQCPSLLAHLAQLADPRARRGRRHPLVSVLAIAVAAILQGIAGQQPAAHPVALS
jgi:hypothetical protein